MFRPLRTVAAVFTVAACVVSASAAGAQTVDEIVAKNIKAKGGAEKWKSVNSVKMTGKMSVQGMELSMITWVKRPNQFRQEMAIQDKKVVTAFDGTTAWMINPMMGSDVPQELTGPQADMAKEQGEDFDGVLLNYKDKGHKVELVGTETLDGTKVHHLRITKKNGKVQEHYLDAESGMEVKTIMSMDQGGTKIDISSEFSNYQSVDGMMFPFTVKQSAGPQQVVVTFEKIEFNPTLDETMFKMPGK